MKIDARRIDGFVANPAPARVVLFHGEDEGLIRELAARLVRNVAGSLDDPFRVSEIERDGYATLPGEVAAMSMTGGAAWCAFVMPPTVLQPPSRRCSPPTGLGCW